MDQSVSLEVFQELSTWLYKQSGKKEWRDNPKLYFILRKLGRETLFQHLLDNHVSDLWLPIPRYVLPKILHDENDRKSFLDAQELCLDDHFPLELMGQHLSFMSSDCLELIEEKPLGTGFYGEVHHVIDPRTGIAYAKKTMSRPMNFKHHLEKMSIFKRELGGMRRVHHQHCVTLAATCTDVDSLIFLSSPVADMDLATFLDLDLSREQLDTLPRAVGCITSALAYLHELNMRHDDFKPNNILIHGSNVLLTDFGFCLDFSADNSISTTRGPPTHFTKRYSAPEVFNHDPRNRLTDVWGLGCVLFEILSRLYGHKLQELKKYWRSSGSHDESYARNPIATASWVRMLTIDEGRTQHGHFRSRMWLLSFIHNIVLQQHRLLRPTAEKILGRLKDLDAAYPVGSSQCWVGPCCNHSTLSESPIIVRRHVPQWPMLDFLSADRHLSFLFLDENLDVLATSGNLSFLNYAVKAGMHKLNHLFTAGPSLGHVREEMRSLNSLVGPRQQISTASATIAHQMMHSVFTGRLNDTTFWVYFFDVKLEGDQFPRLRTVQISLHSIALEREPGYRTSFIVMTFDPEEGKVATTFDSKKAMGFSYKEGREAWTDGFDLSTDEGNEKKRDVYLAITAQVSQRQKDFDAICDKRRMIARVIFHPWPHAI